MEIRKLIQDVSCKSFDELDQKLEMILEKYKGQVVEVFDYNISRGYNAVLVDVDTAGCLFYNMNNDTTIYLPYSSFSIFKDGKPEDRKYED